jgi:cytochrome c553
MFRSVVVAMLISVATAACADSIEDKAALCEGCHGLKGVPQYPTAPIIWGQNEGYLYLELRDFQKGARKDDRMTPIAQSLSKEEVQALAAYFAGKPWPNIDTPRASKADEAAAMTANNSVVCTSCHLEQFQGDSSIPRLAGQEHEYLAKTMMDFRTRTRANNPGMSDLIHTVTPEQLSALATYLAGL